MSSASFPSEMLKAYVVTIPKPVKEPTCPANFRPISLLNTDVKQYAKILAHRLLPILPSLIKPDQSRFTPGRQASDATRRVFNVMQYAGSCRVPSLLLSLDAGKAFDRIHWGYMRHTTKIWIYWSYFFCHIGPLFIPLCTSLHVQHAINYFHHIQWHKAGMPPVPLNF